MPAPAVSQTVLASIQTQLSASQTGFSPTIVESTHQFVTGPDISVFYVAFPASALTHTIDSPAGTVRLNTASLLVSGIPIAMAHVNGYSIELARITPGSPATGSCTVTVTSLLGTATMVGTDTGILIAASADTAAAFAAGSIAITFAGAGNNLYARLILWGTIA